MRITILVLALFVSSSAFGQQPGSNPMRLPNGQPNPNWVNKTGGWKKGQCHRYAVMNDCQRNVRYDTRDFQCKCIGQ
jgi:hypothetical protein